MSLNIDHIYDEIGELGLQQRKYCLGLFLFNVYGSFHMLQFTFVGYAVDFRCLSADQDTPFYSECPGRMSSKCVDLNFPDLEKESTIVSEWNLVCDKTSLAPLTMSVFMAGVMAGALIMGIVADAFGRRKTLGLCLSQMIVINGLSAITPDYTVYCLLKFLDGVFCGGYILSSFVLCNELIGASKRGLVGNIIQGFFALGIVIFSVLGHFVRHWRWLTAITSLLGMPLLLIVLYLPESPRWLQSKGQIREALVVLKHIAQGNGQKFNERLLEKQDSHSEEKTTSQRNTMKHDSFLELFKNSVLTKLTVIQIFSWFVNSATYYGLTLSASGSSQGGHDRYTSTALSGCVEIPAYVLSIFLLTFKGRRWTTCAFMLSGGSALLSLIIFTQVPWMANSMSLLCKLCISASFAVIYIWSGEIFPTTIRNTAMGLVSVAARIGGILAPFLAQLGDYSTNLHLLVFGGMTFSAGLLNAFLPETQGQALPESIDDLLQYLKNENLSKVKPGESSKSTGEGYKRLSTEDV